MGRNKVIGIYGVFSVGKSLLAHGVSSRFLDSDTVATDNLLAIARNLDRLDPYLQQSSYTAWKIFGDSSIKNVIEGFKIYRGRLQPYLKMIYERAHAQRVDMIFEGVHISPEVLREYEGVLDTRPILITILDKETHWKRIQDKCKDRPALLKRITHHFETALSLQDFLIEESKRFNVPVIENNESVEKTLDKLMEILK